MQNCQFVKQCVIKAPVDQVFRWHARPGALERLNPPWDPLEVTSRTGGIQPGAKVVMQLKAGPLPLKIKWVAQHGRYEQNRLFEDRQIKGPFARWIHTHRFSHTGEAACLLEDEIQYALPFHPLSSFLGRALIRKKLERIFRFRHAVTRMDIADHLRFKRGPLTLLARTLARLPEPPGVLICASAIGYYGNRGTAWMTEQSDQGSDFISKVCSRWEQSTTPAAEKGIRTVLLRIGIALSPSGGALQKFLLPFQFGLGGKLGSGAQYMSWIHRDDVLGAIYHLLDRQDIQGVVNVVAPDPVTNQAFVQTLGRVLTRPCVFSIPESIIRIMFGEMGREIPLSSTRVSPVRFI